jgi:hypothetical protein
MTEPVDQPTVDAAGSGDMDPHVRERRVEMTAAVILSIATIVTAWSAYQATRWSGEQAANYVTASARRVESVRASSRADTLTSIDVAIYLDWLDATQVGDTELAEDLESRMREEFLPAFDAWRATAPGEAIPPGHPFTRPEYVLADREEAASLEAEASQFFTDGQEANQVSDNFVLAAVMLASVLFFAGLAGTFDAFRAQIFLLVLAVVMLVTGTIIVFLLPQDVGI